MEHHHLSGSVLSSSPAFPALAAGSCWLCPLSRRLLSASYPSKPGGDTPPFHCTVPAPVSSAAPLGSVLICCNTTEESRVPRGMTEPCGARMGDTMGSLSLPRLGAGAGDGQRCLAHLGARDVQDRGGQSCWAMLRLMLVAQLCLCLSLTPATLSHSNELPFDCAFISPAFFSFIFLSEYTLCTVRPGSSLSWRLGSRWRTPGVAEGRSPCITWREALGSSR